MKWIAIIVCAAAMTMIPEWSKNKKKKIQVAFVKVILIVSLITLCVTAFNSGFSDRKKNSIGGSSMSVICPNCGTEFRKGTTGASMIREYGHCQICNGR